MSDQVTVAVISSIMRATVDEMAGALRRSAHSPIIREMYDFSCAIFTQEGETVAQDNSIPAFLGTMAITLPSVIESAAGSLDPGDVFIANDPYAGGTHTPDIQIFAPVFAAGELVAWAGAIAHHSDVGGSNPGTEGYANRSIFEEGMRIPPLRFVSAGELNLPLLQLIQNNIRDPASTAGDLRAQLAAVKLGVRRIAETIDHFGVEVLRASLATGLDQSERRIKASIARHADGRGTAVGWLDDDGLGSDPVRIEVAVEVEGDSVTVDLDGTAPQMRSGLNLSQAAARAAIFFVVKAIFDPTSPQDGGAMRSVRALLPQGTIANPNFPAAVSLRHLGALRLADTLIRAFGELYPSVAVGGTFVGFSSMAAECRHPRLENPVIIQDDLGGGMGAHAGGDGLDAVDVLVGNVQMLPAEVCELSYPVRILATELVVDSAGDGTYRGGMGMRRIYEFLDDADGVFYSEQTKAEFAAYGIRGGHAGTPATMTLERADSGRVEIGKQRLRVGRGDRLVTVTGGGGGFGPPSARDSDLVRRDLLEEKISPERAREVYGVSQDVV